MDSVPRSCLLMQTNITYQGRNEDGNRPDVGAFEGAQPRQLFNDIRHFTLQDSACNFATTKVHMRMETFSAS